MWPWVPDHTRAQLDLGAQAQTGLGQEQVSTQWEWGSVWPDPAAQGQAIMKRD